VHCGKSRGAPVGTADADKTHVILRLLAKNCLASVYTLSGAHRFSRAGGTPGPFIAGYHRVVKDFDAAVRHTIPSMLISAGTFEKHLDWVGRRFRFVSLDDIGSHLESERPFSQPTAAITFDDGYADVYHNAFPILKRKGVPAAVFVVTDMIGTRESLVHDRLYTCLLQTACDPLSTMTTMLTTMPQTEVVQRLQALEAKLLTGPQHRDELLPLSWDMIEEMQRSGITIGSHTKSHVLLTSERAEEALRQVIESKRSLESRLKRSVNHFAYPDGRFNRCVLQAVRDAGYRFGYSICRKRDSQFPLLTISRKVLWEKACITALGQFSPSVMRCQVDGIFERSGICDHVH
jgi:peptidoglycan/xylan/chitin deacetylase (PgdA/CDA1 family)